MVCMVVPLLINFSELDQWILTFKAENLQSHLQNRFKNIHEDPLTSPNSREKNRKEEEEDIQIQLTRVASLSQLWSVHEFLNERIP